MARSRAGTFESDVTYTDPPNYNWNDDGGRALSVEELNFGPGAGVVELEEEYGAEEYLGPREPTTTRSVRSYLLSMDRNRNAFLVGLLIVGLIGIIVLVVLLTRS